MPLKESEAIVLRTYPFRESDLLVTTFWCDGMRLLFAGIISGIRTINPRWRVVEMNLPIFKRWLYRPACYIAKNVLRCPSFGILRIDYLTYVIQF